MIVVKVIPTQYATLQDQLKQQEGLDLAGNSGTLQKAGVTASYNYNPATATLQIDVVSKPFLISKSAVEGHLRQALTEHGYLTV